MIMMLTCVLMSSVMIIRLYFPTTATHIRSFQRVLFIRKNSDNYTAPKIKCTVVTDADSVGRRG